MLSVNKQEDTYLYRQVIDLISENINTGTLRPGDRLPSLRKMSNSAGVSIPTVRQAYVELERQRRIESRPQSGFYVRHRATNALVHPAPSSDGEPVCLNCRPLMVRVYELGIANPCMAKPAAKTLHRAMKRIMARAEERSLGYASTLGEASLRRQIAYHYLDSAGVQVEPDHIAITNGGQEALLLALQAVASPGDVIAVETPTYHGLLELIDSLGMLAVEVETCPEEGVVLAELRRTLEQYPVKACMFSTSLSNPLGVIEDDVYGDLRFDGVRPVPTQFLCNSARIITCGSFSKTAAPGYRIGWVLAPHFIEEITRLKRAFSCSSGLLQQMTLTDFLASGNYSRHLKTLRPVLRQNAERMSAMIANHFPAETRSSKPVGGAVLWLELPSNVSAEELFNDAIEAGISIAPGQIFSPSSRYTNFVRLGFGHPWSERTEDAIRWLGQRVTTLSMA